MRKGLLIIIPCGRAKIWQNEPDLGQVQAKKAYIGAPFVVNRRFAEQNADRWVILSARYGFIDPDRYIMNYDDTFINPGPCTIQLKCLIHQLKERDLLGFNRVIGLGGKQYRQRMTEAFAAYEQTVAFPAAGLRIGEAMAFVNAYDPHKPHQHHDPNSGEIPSGKNGLASQFRVEIDGRSMVDRFYQLICELSERAGGMRRLGDCDGRMPWPKQGVYFIFNPQEKRAGSQQLRVVRVGTHALRPNAKADLWGRLRAHRGPMNGKWHGGGNHRGSVFRLHVGHAMMERDHWPDVIRKTWGVGANAPLDVRQAEYPYERKVSDYIRNLLVLTLKVEGPGSYIDRAFMERNAIALLSHGSKIDPASETWLGSYSNNQAIIDSGLWNVRHVNSSVDPDFLDRFESFLSAS